MSQLIKVIVIISFSIFVGCNPAIREIYVNPTGSSQNTGSQELQVSTIQEALDKALAYKMEDAQTQITIHVSEGEYRLNKSMQFNAALSGVKIIGAGVDKVVVKGSQQLDLEWKEYKDQILVAKVNSQIQFDLFFDWSLLLYYVLYS